MTGPLDRHGSSAVDLRARLDAERAGAAFLVYRDEERRQRIVLLDRERLTIGRGVGADVRLEWDNEISRTHAEIERVGETWAVTDDGLSTNGTFCNGERLRGRRRLADGDQLRFGRTLVAFRAPALADGATTTAPGRRCGPRSRSRTRSDACSWRCAARCSTARSRRRRRTSASPSDVFLGVDAVKVHLRALYRKLGISALPHNQKRARLVELAFQQGLVAEHDLGDE